MSLLSSLKAYYDLDEESGTRDNDEGDANNDLSVYGSIGHVDDATHGVVADFPGNDDNYLYCTGPADLHFGDSDFTMAVWMYPRANDNYRWIVAHEGSADREYNIMFNAGQGNQLCMDMWVDPGGTNDWIWVDSASIPAVDNWHFVVAWHNAGDDTINISLNNGAPESYDYTPGAAFDSPNTMTFMLSHNIVHATSNFCFWGYLSKLGMWGRVLTSDERTALYNSGNGLKFAELDTGNVRAYSLPVMCV